MKFAKTVTLSTVKQVKAAFEGHYLYVPRFEMVATSIPPPEMSRDLLLLGHMGTAKLHLYFNSEVCVFIYTYTYVAKLYVFVVVQLHSFVKMTLFF